MNLIIRGAAREDGTQPVPLVNVVASEAVIEYLLSHLDDDSGEPLPLAFNVIDKRCELIDGTHGQWSHEMRTRQSGQG